MNSKPLYALSVRQPWAWLVVHGYKNVENRTWPTDVRGPILIHASARMTRQEYGDARYFAFDTVPGKQTDKLLRIFPVYEEMERGGIVGQAEIVDCVTASRSPWFGGPYGFVLKNAKPLPFQPMPGELRFFAVTGEQVDRAPAVKILTSYWASPKLKSFRGVCVGISRGVPKWKLPYSYKRLIDLAPSAETWNAGGNFQRCYRAQLDAFGVEAIRGMLTAKADGKPVALLCWEVPGAFCHRRVFAMWWKDRTGEEIAELS